jgi:hypothetical protein
MSVDTVCAKFDQNRPNSIDVNQCYRHIVSQTHAMKDTYTGLITVFSDSALK